MNNFKVDETTYFYNIEGMVMFSLKNTKDTRSSVIDSIPDNLFAVKMLYPSGNFGNFYFKTEEEATAWIIKQMELDQLACQSREEEIREKVK